MKFISASSGMTFINNIILKFKACRCLQLKEFIVYLAPCFLLNLNLTLSLQFLKNILPHQRHLFLLCVSLLCGSTKTCSDKNLSSLSDLSARTRPKKMGD